MKQIYECSTSATPKIGAPLRIAATEAPGITVELFQMATGGYFVHAQFDGGSHYYSPIIRDENVAGAHAAQMAHNAFVAAERATCEAGTSAD